MAESCYVPKYIVGSYKGISFDVLEASSEHGRRGAEGEFPFGENTGYADLGRKIRTYSISARFRGNGHIAQAALLIAACELKGPGVLVHPTRGVILSAAVRSLKVSDDIEENMGITKVDIEFVEANNWPNSLSLVSQLLGLFLTPILTASRASFAAAYNISAVQPFRKAAVVGAAQNQVANINLEYAKATVATKATDVSRNSILNDMTRVASEYALAVDATNMDRALALGMQAVANETSGMQKFQAFRRIANGAAAQSGFLKPAKTAENAVYANVRIIAAAYMAEAIYETEGLTNQEIFSNIDVVESVLSQEMVAAQTECDSALFLELSKFKTETLAKLYGHAYNAPGQLTYQFNGGVHHITAAYAIFGDAKRHRELEKSNVIAGDGRIGSIVTAARGTI